MEIIKINPQEDYLDKIKITDELIKNYSLEEWANNFNLMTAGYRDQLDPKDPFNPKVAFNIVTVAILGEAKARVLKRHFNKENAIHIHIGGETRPHTQDFISILARVYAAHNFKVHLRAQVKTTPVWYSSYGIFYEEFQSGENLTASHSPFFKGGWKPMDSDGKQLLTEEDEIITEVKNIVENRDTIHLAPWISSGNILRDFNVDDPYIKYLVSIVGIDSIDKIRQAGKEGFRCSICPLGGSMKATTERLFHLLDISTGESGIIQYFWGEEDSRYHEIGIIGGDNFGVDPTKEEVYKHIGAQQLLLNRKANVVFIWDPDGDRFNIVTTARINQIDQARALGLKVDKFTSSRGDISIVYFSANQIFLMLTAYRIALLKAANLLDEYDWFISCSISTAYSLEELAIHENIPIARVRVGFKYNGTLAEAIEKGVNVAEHYVTLTTTKDFPGKRARAVIMCEESGGASFGSKDLLMNKSGTRGLLALREKD
jgi:phosphomannomutase